LVINVFVVQRYEENISIRASWVQINVEFRMKSIFSVKMNLKSTKMNDLLRFFENLLFFSLGIN